MYVIFTVSVCVVRFDVLQLSQTRIILRIVTVAYCYSLRGGSRRALPSACLHARTLPLAPDTAINKMSASQQDSPLGRQGLMIVHLAKLLNQGDINERAYELAVKQLVLNTPPTGESKGSPLPLNSGGKYSSNRKVSVPPLPSREGDVKGVSGKG